MTTETTQAATSDNTTTTTAAVTAGAEGLGHTAETQSTQQQTTAQTQEQAKPEEGAKPDTKQADAGPPDAYEIKVPDGVSMDETAIDAFSSFAREQGLTNDAAQAFIDKLGPVMTQRRAQQVEAIQQQWFDASKSDKEFGGANFEQNLAVAQQALEKFGSPELKQFLVESGLGKHPEIIRAFHKVGKAVSEDSLVTGQGSGAPTKSMAQRMYKDMNP